MTKEIKEFIQQWLEDNSVVVSEACGKIWDFAETGLEEFRSSEYLKETLKANDFTIEAGSRDMPTSFAATWGSGEPCIGFLAEYDALDGMSQKHSSAKEPITIGAPGHACGHNTIASSMVGAVLALQAAICRENIPGTIVFYGCPAEEDLVGKVRMVREHLFERCDILLSCHPNDISYVWARKSVALKSVKFNFFGVSAHAGLDPYNGRSALDAVELMNVGANYLREHLPPGSKLHYVICNGGDKPNIVPDQAQVWYVVRASNRETVDDVYRRLLKVAQGAALMTETTFEEHPLSSCCDYLPNQVLAQTILEYMHEVGVPEWETADKKFASELFRQIPKENFTRALNQFSFSTDDVEDGLAKRIYDGFYDKEPMGASTDVGDVSWQVPTGAFSFQATVVGAPGHSWFYTASCGSSLGEKGSLIAAKILALTACRLLTDTEVTKAAKAEFEKAHDNSIYKAEA